MERSSVVVFWLPQRFLVVLFVFGVCGGVGLAALSGPVPNEDGPTTATWNASGPREVIGGTYLAFTPEWTTATSVNARIAVYTRVASALASGLPLGISYGVALLVCLSVGGHPRARRRTLLRVVGAIGLTVVSAWLFTVYTGANTSTRITGIPLFLVGVATFGALSAVRPTVHGFEGARRRVGGLVAVPGVVAVLSIGDDGSSLVAIMTVLVVACYLAPLADDGQRWFLGAIVVVAPTVALLAPLPFSRSTISLLLVFVAVPAAPFSVRAYLVGANTPVTSRGEGIESARSD
jgi:hypothetical protein